MADTIAMLFAKDPQIGVGYYLNQCSSPLRVANKLCKYDAATCTTCSGGMYDCGSVLSGTVWDIWQQLDATSPATSADIIRELTFSSVLLHSGTSIDSSIAIDMLTLDDNDALLGNGTPHYSEICAGFTAHGMTCPAIVNGPVVKTALPTRCPNLAQLHSTHVVSRAPAERAIRTISSQISGR